jgi:hypothetical protein
MQVDMTYPAGANLLLPLSAPSAILSHPHVHRLMTVISTHESLLVQQATLLHIILRALRRHNITLEQILVEEEGTQFQSESNTSDSTKPPTPM